MCRDSLSIWWPALAITTLKLTFSYHSRSCTSYSFLASIEIDSFSSYAIISFLFQGLNSVSGALLNQHLWTFWANHIQPNTQYFLSGQGSRPSCRIFCDQIWAVAYGLSHLVSFNQWISLFIIHSVLNSQLMTNFICHL